MGEARAKEEAAIAAVAEVAKNGGTENLALRPEQAAVVSAFQRVTAAIHLESNQLAGIYKQREAAGELANAIEHLNRWCVRYIADCQRSIIIPKVAIP